MKGPEASGFRWSSNALRDCVFLPLDTAFTSTTVSRIFMHLPYICALAAGKHGSSAAGRLVKANGTGLERRLGG